MQIPDGLVHQEEEPTKVAQREAIRCLGGEALYAVKEEQVSEAEEVSVVEEEGEISAIGEEDEAGNAGTPDKTIPAETMDPWNLLPQRKFT